MSEKTTEVRYIVRRRFKYGKIHYQPGDTFVPAGGKFDEQILKSNLVSQDLSRYRHASRLTLRQRKGNVKIGAKASARLAESATVQEVAAAPDAPSQPEVAAPEAQSSPEAPRPARKRKGGSNAS